MVRNFRKFTSPCEIKDIRDGITIIAGDNEEGKSTLLSAVRSVIFEKHDSKAKQLLLEMYPSGSKVSVEIKLDFEFDAQLHRLEKTFGSKPSAILKKHDGSVVEGHAAEDELSQILTFRVPERGKSKDDDHGLLGFFWLEQGHSLDKLNLGKVGREKLRASLAQEVGDVMGGSLGRIIMQKARKKHDELLTNTGKPHTGGRLANAIIEKEEKKKNAEYLEKKENEYLQEIEDLERVINDLQQLNSVGDLESAQRALKEAEDHHEQIEELQKKSESIGHEIKRAEGELLIVENRWQERQAILDSVTRLEEDIVKVKGKLNEGTQEDVEAISRNAEKDLEKAAEDKRNAELKLKLASLHQLKKELNNLDKEILKVDELNKQLQTAQVERDSAKVNQNSFNNLESISNHISDLQKEISASATHVCFLPIEKQTVASTSGNIEANQRVEVSKKERFTLDGFGEVEIEPAVANLPDKQRKLNNKKSELEAALAKAKLGNMKEAISHFKNYQEAKKKVEEAEIRIKHLPQDMHALRVSRKNKETEFNRLCNDIGDVEVTEEIDMHTAKQHLELAIKKEEKARVAKDNTQQNKHRWERGQSELKGELGKITRDLDVKKEELKDARQKYSDEKLVAEINSKKTQLANKKDQKEKIDDKVAAANPEEISLRREKAKDTIKTITDKQKELDRKKVQFKERLNVKGVEGIGEKLESARGEAEKADADYERIQQEANAWKLLVETLTEAEREAKEMFVDPVLKHVSPFLSLLFPQARPIFDEENMEIKELCRDSKEEPFLNLSVGTREQLAILVRLAFAVYLKEKGYPSMVILDDALVYADDNRFERMQLALRKAAKSVQIIILTCRSRDWNQSGFPIRNLADAVIAEE